MAAPSSTAGISLCASRSIAIENNLVLAHPRLSLSYPSKPNSLKSFKPLQLKKNGVFERFSRTSSRSFIVRCEASTGKVGFVKHVIPIEDNLFEIISSNFEAILNKKKKSFSLTLMGLVLLVLRRLNLYYFLTDFYLFNCNVVYIIFCWLKFFLVWSKPLLIIYEFKIYFFAVS